ncbi:hypothetical protein [Nocardioides sp. NPDC006303]|uniref:hypothetical protein n=1 Tax=Nocardioides sp. NPDC006303 TaxID=3156747 RepID=UPI0033B2C36C
MGSEMQCGETLPISSSDIIASRQTCPDTRNITMHRSIVKFLTAIAIHAHKHDQPDGSDATDPYGSSFIGDR